MNWKFSLGLALLSPCILFTNTLAQSNNFLADYLVRWNQSRDYLVAVAETMPANKYDFNPASEQRTFAEQLMHIALIIDWHGFSKVDGQGHDIRWENFKAEGRSKKEIISIVKREFNRAATLIENFDPQRLNETEKYARFTRTRRQLLMLMADHVSHHRGQLVVYLRLKGIKPPNYINFQ